MTPPKLRSMSRRPVAVISVAILVVLAGCGGVLGGDGAGPSNGDPSLDPGEYPPGLNESGLTDASLLSETHAQTLAAVGFEATYSIEVNIAAPTGSRTQQIDQRVVAGAGLSTFFVNATTTQGDRTANTQYWGNESVAVQRTRSGEQIQYRPLPERINRTQQFTFGTTLNQLSRFGDYSLDSTDTENGQQIFTFTADSVNPDLGSGNSTLVDAENVSSLSSTLEVRENGVVQSFDLEFNASTTAGETSYSVSFDLEDTGDRDVAEPSWLESALSNITSVDLSATLENQVIRIDHNGGDPVPSESVLIVQANETIYQTTLEESIEAGSSVYLSLNRSSGSIEVVDSTAAGTQVTGEVTLLLTTSDRETLLSTTLNASTQDGE